MKKILLGTTAIIALGALSSQALAAEKIKLGIGGFMREYVSNVKSDQTKSNTRMKLGQWSNTEIHFKGSTTLDNGLTVAARVELEGDRNGAARSIDVSTLTVSGDTLGAFTIGSMPQASDTFAVKAPIVGPAAFSDVTAWAKFNSTVNDANAITKTNGRGTTSDFVGGNKGNKIQYVTPSFSGFSAFASYDAAQNVDKNAKRAALRSDTGEAYALGVTYDGEISGVALTSDLSRTKYQGGSTSGVNDGDGQTLTRFGLNAGMGGFTVGGSYSHYKGVTRATTTVDSLDGNGWDFGVGYNNGPYSVSAAYNSAKAKGTTRAGDDKFTAWTFGAGYDMGAGVSLVAQYFNGKLKNETPAVATDPTSSTVNGVIGGIEVSF
ncbi:porin [Varunaivibrio sulfuroxidans]|uniref:Outer membrane protein OmpU n=1 Tax=Varunaivibrio sulfuroxidans TaxID=1773489 RepID=A0A4R3JHV6_9PROT|nr:porin [Varunaivibrio sulfuroxidans]TCS64846.1 outer membrane protein OmpU [Varunaivibrio sulfuroxidans]WES29853.1 porin [Varunaivibrio sulfuroxidans]